MLRGPDLNRESLGYEPSMLPLHHPAALFIQNDETRKSPSRVPEEYSKQATLMQESWTEVIDKVSWKW